MKLNVHERMIALGLMAAIEEGKIAFMKAKQDIVNKVGFSAEENEEYGVVHEDQMVRWDPEKGLVEKDIDLSGAEKAMIVDALKKLDDEDKIRDEHVPLWDKFVN